MKHRDLIRVLEKRGCVFIWHGGNHDWYQTETKISQPVPRHREIKDHLARYIIKMLQNKV